MIITNAKENLFSPVKYSTYNAEIDKVKTNEQGNEIEWWKLLEH